MMKLSCDYLTILLDMMSSHCWQHSGELNHIYENDWYDSYCFMLQKKYCICNSKMFSLKIISLNITKLVIHLFDSTFVKRLGKCCEEITESERDQTKRIVYSVMYGVGMSYFQLIIFTNSYSWIFLFYYFSGYLECTASCLNVGHDNTGWPKRRG